MCKNSSDCETDCCGTVIRTNQEKTLENILQVGLGAGEGRGKILKLNFYLQALTEATNNSDKSATIIALEKIIIPADELFFTIEKTTTSLSRVNEGFNAILFDLFECPCRKFDESQFDKYDALLDNLYDAYDDLVDLVNDDYVTGSIIIQDELNKISVAIYQPTIDWAGIKAMVATMQIEMNLFITDQPIFKSYYEDLQNEFFDFSLEIGDDGLMSTCEKKQKIVWC
jgi:hypothetical protein